MPRQVSLNRKIDKKSKHYKIASKLVEMLNDFKISGDSFYYLVIYIYHTHKDKFNSFTPGFHSRIMKNDKFLVKSSLMKFVTGQSLNIKYSEDDVDISDNELDNWNEFLTYFTPIILSNYTFYSKKGKYISLNRSVSFNQILIEQIDTIIGDNISSNTPILDYFSNEYAIHKNSVSQFLLAFPEVFFHFLRERTNNEIQVSDLIDFNKKSFIKSSEKNGLPQFKKDKSNSENYDYKDLNEFNSFYFGQSQNPNREQLSLILEYGKLLRVAKTYKKELKIIFSDLEWSKLNRVYNNIIKEDYSAYNYEFRKDILGKINIKYNYKSEIKYVIHDYAKKINIKDYDDEEAFRTECRFLNSLYSFLKESDFYGGEGYVNIPESHKMLDTIHTRDFKSGISKIKDGESIIVHPIYSKFPLEVIKIVVEHFKENIDENTFFYILIQKMAQFTFENDLKFGVRSEYVFDKSFMKWDNLMEPFHKEEVKMQRTSLYYNPYFYSENKDDYALPYYWPSGVLKNDEMAEKKLLFLNDDKSKISKLINSTPIDQILIQLTDLLSFLFEYKLSPSETKEIITILTTFNTKMGSDFENRKKDSFNEKIKSSQFISPFLSLFEFPFYYYPYLMYFEDESSKKVIKLLYIDMIIFTFNLLNYKPTVDEIS